MLLSLSFSIAKDIGLNLPIAIKLRAVDSNLICNLLLLGSILNSSILLSREPRRILTLWLVLTCMLWFRPSWWFQGGSRSSRVVLEQLSNHSFQLFDLLLGRLSLYLTLDLGTLEG